MEISLDKKTDIHAFLHVKIVESDYKADLDKQLKDQARRIQVKGFRPGKVPVGYVRNMIGRDLKIQLVSQLLEERIGKHLEEQGEQILVRPLERSSDLDAETALKQPDFTFEFEMCVQPKEIEIDLSQARITDYLIPYTDEDLAEEIDRLRKQHGERKKVEEVEKGDLVMGKIKSVDGTFDSQAYLPLDALEDDYEEAVALFVGKKQGETVTFDLEKHMPNEDVWPMFGLYEKEDGSKHTGEYEISLDAIERQVPAEFNQELFDKLAGQGRVDSEEGLREHFKTLRAHQREKLSATLFVRQLEDQMAERVEIDFPEGLLRDRLKEQYEQVRDREGDEETPEALTEEQLEQSLVKMKKELVNEVVLKRVNDEAGLQVGEEDIREHLRLDVLADTMGMGFAMNLTDEQITGLMQSEGQADRVRRTINEAYIVKLRQYAKDKVMAEEKTVTMKEYFELVEAYNRADEPEPQAAPETQPADKDVVEEAEVVSEEKQGDA